MTISKITKAYTRTYTDSGQVTTYVEWIDDEGRKGRTEGNGKGTHMKALLARARREGVNR
jgi:hypothetical protein